MTKKSNAPAAADRADVNAAPALEDLHNLGPKSAAMLRQAGIKTPVELKELGALIAYDKVKRAVPGVSLNLLWALEGALSARAWQEVSRSERTSLLVALDDLHAATLLPPSRPRG